MKDRHIVKSHNKSMLLYHIVSPAKYRRKVFSKSVEKTLRKVCQEISTRYEIHFIEIGSDENHVHFLVQSVPMYSPKKIVNTVKASQPFKYLNYIPKSKPYYGEVNFGQVVIM